MKLYGREITQQYIQCKKGKRKYRYPFSEEYPKQAATQVQWNNSGKEGKNNVK